MNPYDAIDQLEKRMFVLKYKYASETGLPFSQQYFVHSAFSLTEDVFSAAFPDCTQIWDMLRAGNAIARSNGLLGKLGVLVILDSEFDADIIDKQSMLLNIPKREELGARLRPEWDWRPNPVSVTLPSSRVGCSLTLCPLLSSSITTIS